MITLFQLSVFVIYVGFLLYTFKKPLPSISDSWYELPNNQKPLFTLFCWSLGIAMLFQGTGETPLFFLSGSGLTFVGAATMFKSTGAHTNIVHYTGAAVGIILALVGIGYENGVWIPLIVWLISTILLKVLKVENSTWWIEIVAFLTIIIGFYL
jgi:hypothetical protein